MSVIMLSEFLKAHKRMQELETIVAQEKKGIEVRRARLKEQAAQIQTVRAQVEMTKSATRVVVNER